MTEVFTAKSLEEAKELAAEKFGKKVSEIKFEIVEEGKKGFLGIGKTDFKVKATVADKAEAPSPAVNTKPAEEIKSEPEVKPVVNEDTSAPVSECAEEKESAPAEEKTESAVQDDSDEDEYSLDNYTVIEDESMINPKVKLARDYIISVFNAMDVKAEFTVYQNETGAIINIESDNNGTIIGRRGETLDAIQYLCSIIANKGDKDYFRITIDCYGYRKKRKETLEQLAAKVAKSVLRTGRSQPLEPMNPYERRVIHSAISEIEGVSSRSVGEEPYRKIIISSNNPRRGGNGDRHRRNDNRDSRGRGARRPRREPFEPKAIDLSTSFEKDYKKPKPEDNMEGGLYGKIEF